MIIMTHALRGELKERLKVRYSDVDIIELNRPAGVFYAVWLGRFVGPAKAEAFALAESKYLSIHFRIRKRDKNP